jgi:hypothetical protein
MIAEIPLPATDEPLEQPFWGALKEGILRVQRCANCACWYFPPRRQCTACQSPLSWTAVSGCGRIWSFTCVHPPVLPAFAPYAPYCVVVVELEESKGLRFTGNVLRTATDQINAVTVQELSVDMPVKALVRRLANDVYWPHWLLTSAKS